MVLTESQRGQLNKQILEYMMKSSYERSAQIFAQESNCSVSEVDSESGSRLQLKWKSILSLQKKVNNLEDELKNMKEELDKPLNRKPNGITVPQDQYMIKTPAKYQLKGHQSPVTCLCFHPSYTQLASCSDDYSLKIWQFETGQFQRTLRGHTGSVTYVTYDSKGRLLASSSSDLTIKLWDADNDYVCFKTLQGHNHSISFVSFLQDDQSIISCSRDKSIKLWEVKTGYCKRTFNGHQGWVRHLALSSDARSFATASQDQSIIIWDITKDTPLNRFFAHDNVIECVLLFQGPHSALLLNAQFLKHKFTPQVRMNALKQLNEQGATGVNNYFQMFVATASRDKLIKLFMCQTGEHLFTFHGHDNWVRSLAIHPSGKYMYSASDDKTIRVWDLNHGKEKKRIDAHEHFISSVRFNAKYGVMASTGTDKVIKVWHLK